jgi:hypothetical protein
MPMQIIPIADTPSQTLTVQLGGQNCLFNLYQKQGALYCDVYVSNTPIVTGVICQNLNRIVRDLYLGFVGDVIFIDTQGTDDPYSPGLGTRFLFSYLETADLNGAG